MLARTLAGTTNSSAHLGTHVYRTFVQDTTLEEMSKEELLAHIRAQEPVLEQLSYDLSANCHYAWRTVINAMLLRRECVLPNLALASPQPSAEELEKLYQAPISGSTLFGGALASLHTEMKERQGPEVSINLTGLSGAKPQQNQQKRKSGKKKQQGRKFLNASATSTPKPTKPISTAKIPTEGQRVSALDQSRLGFTSPTPQPTGNRGRGGSGRGRGFSKGRGGKPNSGRGRGKAQ